MKKRASEILIMEIPYLGALLLLSLIMFKIVFFRSSVLTVSRSVLSLFWIYAIPGYFVMIYWNDKINFLERFFIGIAVCAAITGISSYYLGLLGLNIVYHMFLLPLVIMGIGYFFFYRKMQKSGKDKE